ncbi:hypothetical protein [Bradyrhizobium sp. NBAIM03]|nr:hypothetical protein [Bradyrhizobium sp. NBAIM03]
MRAFVASLFCVVLIAVASAAVIDRYVQETVLVAFAEHGVRP